MLGDFLKAAFVPYGQERRDTRHSGPYGDPVAFLTSVLQECTFSVFVFAWMP